jgi:coiled-coil domain-containing protein 22
MDEADRILLDTLRSIGCELTTDINRVNQLNQDLFVECVARLLNTIIPNENFPSKLPPTTGIKYRICTKFASSCQHLGYKNEIGYQTFLYSNEHDMRRLLMFLVEKLPKDYSQLQSEDLNVPKERLFQQRVAQKINLMLSQFWIPFYCKSKGLRYLNENLYVKEGVQCLKKFHTNHLSTPNNYLNGKAKYSQDQLKYFNENCDLITKQTTGESSRVLSSLIQRNTIDKLKEQDLFKDKQKKNDNLNRLRQSIKKSLEHESVKSNQILTYDDLADIEGLFKRNASSLATQKGSRFTLSENLQFKNESNDVTVGLSGTNEEVKLIF